MLGRSLRGLAIAAVAAYVFGPSPAAAVTQVTACRDLDKAGETYLLINDVSSNNVCFRVLADRITLDLGGHTITGPGSVDTAVGIWDFNGVRTSTIVKNGIIKAFEFGINLRFSSRSTIRNVTVSDHTIGMQVGPDNLVKDCIAQRNFNGIVAGDRVQVENCTVGDAEPGAGVDGNGGIGIVGGQRMLITRTTANGNGVTGILVGIRSTVTHSTASNNGNDGIAVGQNSLVTRNTTNDNDGDGIEAVCPSTITHNTAQDNLGPDIFEFGAGCVVLHNTTSPVGCLTGDSELAAC